jgi:hypothetical protein
MRITATVNRKGDLSSIFDSILAGVETGMAIGGEMMEQVVEATANDMARYPTGELEASITYDPITSGVITTGRIVAGTDHATPFAMGASVHFVPYDEADERIKAGLYPHIKPVYEGDSYTLSGNQPKGAYKAPITVVHDSNRPIIGYLASSSAHPFMEEGFKASKDTLLQEIANQIEAQIGG